MSLFLHYDVAFVVVFVPCSGSSHAPRKGSTSCLRMPVLPDACALGHDFRPTQCNLVFVLKVTESSLRLNHDYTPLLSYSCAGRAGHVPGAAQHIVFVPKLTGTMLLFPLRLHLLSRIRTVRARPTFRAVRHRLFGADSDRRDIIVSLLRLRTPA